MPTDHQIATLVGEQRKEKDYYFKTAQWSPIPRGERKTFKGLKYYPYDKAFRLAAQFHPNPEPEEIIMGASHGEDRRYLRYGYFEFHLGDRLLRLPAYKSSEHNGESLFVPFRDATSGKDTYGAGRYLDIQEEPSGSYIIDFNLAYSPYCAYNEDYVCPLPPRENWLDVPILAGEKSYHSHEKPSPPRGRGLG